MRSSRELFGNTSGDSLVLCKRRGKRMMTRHIFLTVLASFLLPQFGVAQSFPGRIDQALLGDWQCDAQRVYITGLGSIEILGSGYRAGRYDAADGVFAIEWDEGGRDDWSYSVGSADMVLTLPDGNDMVCTPRS
jgi:hypothetical protein